MRLVIMGPPGAGKGTQGKRLAVALSVPDISTGAILRDHVAQGTELGQEIGRLINNGDYVPDETITRIVGERLAQPDTRAGFLLDGFPRTINQAYALRDMLAASHLRLDHVIYLKVDPNALVARMMQRAETEGRQDDTEETIRYRQQVYADETAPLLELYRASAAGREMVLEINGEGTMDEVQERILTRLRSAHDDGV